MSKLKVCPRCSGPMSKYPAVSRRDNKTEICSNCGVEEALFDAQIIITGAIKTQGLMDAERAWLKKKPAKFIYVCCDCGVYTEADPGTCAICGCECIEKCEVEE